MNTTAPNTEGPFITYIHLRKIRKAFDQMHTSGQIRDKGHVSFQSESGDERKDEGCVQDTAPHQRQNSTTIIPSHTDVLPHIQVQWNLSIKDTLDKGHLSNEDTVCSPNHTELCTHLPLN